MCERLWFRLPGYQSCCISRIVTHVEGNGSESETLQNSNHVFTVAINLYQ